MATIRIWDVKTRLDRVINYAIDRSKTLNLKYEEVEFQDLHRTLSYAVNPNKTEDKYFATGVNCEIYTAYKQMINTKKFFCKKGGILAFHAYQSFAKGEVDASTAHEIGVEFARKMWGKHYEVVVATHCNTGCYHNHFVINSVAFTDGKKYNDCKESYSLMREISDTICKEHGLSVIENPGKGTHKSYVQYMVEKNGEWTKDSIIKRDIDECIDYAISPQEFYMEMKKRGYYFNFNRKYATVSHPKFDRPRRLKTLGWEYTPEQIEDRIMSTFYSKRADIPEQDNVVERYIAPLDNSSYIKLYVNFVTVVEIVKHNPNKNRDVDKYLIDEMKKLDKLIEQQNLLCDNDIETPEQLVEFKNEIIKELKEVVESRDDMYILLKRAERRNDTVQVSDKKSDISLLSERAKILRKNLRIIKRIEDTEPKIEEKVNRIKADTIQKEMSNNDSFRRCSRANGENEPARS